MVGFFGVDLIKQMLTTHVYGLALVQYCYLRPKTTMLWKLWNFTSALVLIPPAFPGSALPWQCTHSSLQLLIQPSICTPSTHYGWVDPGNMEYEVCQTLLHMASTWNWTPDLLILSSNTLSTRPHALTNEPIAFVLNLQGACCMLVNPLHQMENVYTNQHVFTK